MDRHYLGVRLKRSEPKEQRTRTIKASRFDGSQEINSVKKKPKTTVKVEGVATHYLIKCKCKNYYQNSHIEIEANFNFMEYNLATTVETERQRQVVCCSNNCHLTLLLDGHWH